MAQMCRKFGSRERHFWAKNKSSKIIPSWSKQSKKNFKIAFENVCRLGEDDERVAYDPIPKSTYDDKAINGW